ncbi:hypothetical protein MtrunA17_Chr5g0402251 [Medicago truncatula]|uniref:Uncharacterized protein n=1 Tax=Medicago truncatula TaxID=3880 RepID=A0A396HL13_MEDTR|nr:hypothetical protein MtrunA17_Chr5g0402251 [Medicago truncatula]
MNPSCGTHTLNISYSDPSAKTTPPSYPTPALTKPSSPTTTLSQPRRRPRSPHQQNSDIPFMSFDIDTVAVSPPPVQGLTVAPLTSPMRSLSSTSSRSTETKYGANSIWCYFKLYVIS